MSGRGKTICVIRKVTLALFILSSTIGVAMSPHSSLPDWHRLMRQWIEKRMGDTGLTLPFLAGALALKRGEATVTAEKLQELIGTMISNPVPGYFVGVRRCGNIRAPVLSALPLEDQLIRQCVLHSPCGQISFAFSPDSAGPFGGLNCDCAADCVEKLIEYCLPYTEIGYFSRCYDKNLDDFVYSKFKKQDIEFIESVLG